MPQSVRRDPRSYRTPGVVNDNLARDLRQRELEERLERSGQLDFDQQYRRRQETQADKLSRERQATRATVRQAQQIPVAAVVGSLILAGLAIMVVYCQVQINAISGSIVEMKETISQLEMEQVLLQTKYEQAFDLATVKESAESVGMHQPSDGQIIYIDLPGEDQAVACRESESGVFARIFSVLSQQMDAVLEYFS